MKKIAMTLFILLFSTLELLPLTVPSLHAKECQDPTFYSQAAQDEFVYILLYQFLGKKDVGYYLEIGAGDPIEINNTYFLEKNFNWKGLSIDISNRYAAAWNSLRSNSLLIIDATRTDYKGVLRLFPPSIDYLSLDIDNNYPAVLKIIPFDKYHFKIITIEHDFYRFGDVFRSEERRILSSLGYYLLCPDVASNGIIFEDWWIYPDAFPEQVFALLKTFDLKGKNYDQILSVLRSVIIQHSDPKADFHKYTEHASKIGNLPRMSP